MRVVRLKSTTVNTREDSNDRADSKGKTRILKIEFSNSFQLAEILRQNLCREELDQLHSVLGDSLRDCEVFPNTAQKCVKSAT